jgi:hypothetical protein
MSEVRVQIVEFIPSDYDDFLIVELTDAFGAVHRFQDKSPIFGYDGDIDQHTRLPVPGTFDCQVTERFQKDSRELVRINTEKPFDIQSLAGGYESLPLPFCRESRHNRPRIVPSYPIDFATRISDNPHSALHSRCRLVGGRMYFDAAT